MVWRELRGVTATISRSFALREIELDIGPSQFMALLGPSGSGKSSLLGLVGGWIEPTIGVIAHRWDRHY